MALVKTDDRQYLRDTRSNALLNTDIKALQRHRGNRAVRQRNDQLAQDVRTLTDRLDALTLILDRLTAE